MLNNNKLATINSSTFNELKSLQRLWLNNNLITKIEEDAMFKNLIKLSI